MDAASPRMRLSLVAVVVAACFVALFARLWYLQVMEAPALAVQATATRTRTVAVDAPRGRILDMNGKVLVDNRTQIVVTIDRAQYKKVADKDALVDHLAEILTSYGTPTKTSALKKRISEQNDPLQPILVASDVTDEVAQHLSERSEDFPSVSFSRRTSRIYPYGAAAGNVLGYVGRITAERLKVIEPGLDPETGEIKTYQPDSMIGLAGVEASYERELRGVPGVETIEIDARNRPVGTVSYQPARAGSDVMLHLDIDVQIRAEQSLVDKLTILKGTPQKDGTIRKAPAGSVVALDPRDGGVIALASYPSYDPREFANGISQERYKQLQNVDGVSALLDRSISGQYAPGSTFKLVTGTAALSNRLITGNDTIYDKGYYEIGNPPERLRNAGEQVNGLVNVTSAMTVSSDVFFYWLGERMDGSTLIQDAARAYGFDQLTGIDLPNEASGYVLTPARLRTLHQKYPKDYPYGDWYTGNTAHLAVGQDGVVVTPLQLARAYAAFANGGTLYEPHVGWRVLRSGGSPTRPSDILRTIEPVVKGTVSLPGDVRGPLAAGFGGATGPDGTAAGAFIGFDQAAFKIDGKTGTAQVAGKADTSWFASYAPATAPRYAIAAAMEESGFGAEASGEVVRHVYELVAAQALTGVAPANSGQRD